MLSTGIRFGEGFDKHTIQKLMKAATMAYEFDVLVIGTNVGGLAFAKEASFAGKKVAVVNYREPTPAEEEGFDEDLDEMSKALGLDDAEVHKKTFRSLVRNSEGNVDEAQGELTIRTYEYMRSLTKPAAKGWSRRVKNNRIDLNNVVTSFDTFGRKILRNIANLRQAVIDAESCGWELDAPEEISAHWTKMTDQVRDYMMHENWSLKNDFKRRKIQYFEGAAEFINKHTVKVTEIDKERLITAEYICISPSSFPSIPDDIPGALSYGITVDDFLRMDEPPGKTLIVGAGAVALECAGIIASFQFPVSVMYHRTVLRSYDRQMVDMIVKDMSKRNVTFLKNTHLVSVRLNGTEERLVARYNKVDVEKHPRKQSYPDSEAEEDEFDSVLFETGRKIFTRQMNFDAIGLRHDSKSFTIYSGKGETDIPHIFAVGEIQHHRLGDPASSELTGKLLGKKVFFGEENQMEYYPVGEVIFTPTEYSFVGLSEDSAISRFGRNYVTVYESFYKPVELVVPYEKEECYVKVVTENKDGRILGIHLYGPDSGEMIQGFVAAVKCGATMTEFRTTLGAHGTKAEEILRVRAVKGTDMDPHASNKPTRITLKSSMESLRL